jgi:hypothetical protein
VEEHGKADAIQYYVEQLLWRDLFKFWFVFNGSVAFTEYGVYNRNDVTWNPEI